MRRPTNNNDGPPRTKESITRRNKFSDALVADAIQLFEERLGRPVTPGEARNMLGDLVDFFVIGARWGRETKARRDEPPGPGD
jgi:hypothetical protein